MKKVETDILIIGGGAAGMAGALAIAENCQKKILVVDDNSRLGGQIWRAELGKIKSPVARKLIGKINKKEINILNSTQVFARSNGKTILAEKSGGVLEIDFDKLILATGARERFLPFPGWTLPNVFGAGGLQALVKGGFPVKNKKIIIAGTGALLLAVAEYLRSKGANVLLIAEQTSRQKLIKFGFNLIWQPDKLFQAFGLKTKLLGVKYQTDSFITSAEGSEKLEAVHLARKGLSKRIECDFLACGFHLVPNPELPKLLGCYIKNGMVQVNEIQETSVKDIYCAGEPTGIGGVEKSLIEGEIAGLMIAGKADQARKLFSKREKILSFSKSLNETFALRNELKTLPTDETIVCRCEDVTYEKLKNFDSFREAKLQARCGMGACQGRICGSATDFLFGWENDSVRPPIFPVNLKNLSE